MYPSWFCPRSLLVDVEVTLEVPTPPLVIADNGGVEGCVGEVQVGP